MARLSWPNRVTITRILLVGPFVLCLLHMHDLTWARHAAAAIFLAMAASDGLDGWLARKLNQTSRLGAILDPIADKIAIACAVILLGYEGTAVPAKKIPDVVVVVAVGKDLVVVLGFFVAFVLTGQVLIKPRLAGKLCTTVQMVMILSVLLWPDLPAAMDKLPDVLWWTATALAVAALADYLRAGTAFIAAHQQANDEASGG